VADPGFGLVVVEDRLIPTLFEASGGRAAVYSETDPVPGHPELGATDEIRPIVLNAQDADVEIRTIRTGFPGRDGYSVAVQRDGDSETSPFKDWQGWNDPVLFKTAISPEGTTQDPTWGTDTFGWISLAKQPGSERLHVFASEAGDPATGLDARNWTYDTRREEWELVGIDWASVVDGGSNPIAIAWDPEGERMLAFHGPGTSNATARGWTAYRGDENGTSWLVYSRGFLDLDELPAADYPGSGGSRLHVVPKLGADWLMVYADNIGGLNSEARQFVSSDRGATWQAVQAAGANIVDGSRHFPCATVTGFCIAYVNSSNEPCVRLLTSAQTDFDNATEIQLDATPRLCDRVACATDDDGTVYVVARDSTNTHEWRIYRSLDNGATWERYTNTVLRALSSGASFTVQDAAFAGGSLYLATRWATTSTTHDEGVVLLVFGGWSTVEGDGGGVSVGRRYRVGFGGDDSLGGAANQPATFIGLELPQNQSWSRSVGGSPTEDLTPAGGEWGFRLTGSASDSALYTSSAGTAATVHRTQSVFLSTFIPLAGSASTAAGGDSGGFVLSAVDDASSPTTGWEAEIRLYDDGYQIRDVHGASTLASDSAAWSAGDEVHMCAHVRDGLVSAWYRVAGDDKWTEMIRDGSLTSNASTTDGILEWGAHGGDDFDVIFRAVHVTTGELGNGIDRQTSVFETSADGTRGIAFGKALPANGLQYPSPRLTFDASETSTIRREWGYLQGRGGPGRYDQVIDIPVGYTYAIENAWPTLSPSPRVQWRSQDTATQQELSFDFGDNKWHGNVLALFVINASPRQWILELDDASTGWTTLGTLDLALGTGLTFIRDGDYVRPDTGTTAIDRYIHEDELVRTAAWFTDGTDVQRVVRNSGGYWTARSGVPKVHLELEDGSSLAASGSSGQLVSGAGLAVFAVPSSPLARRYLRVRVASGQLTPDGDYRAGVIGVGRVVAAGADPSWGWTRRVELSRELSRRTDQFLELRPTGPARAVLTYSWPDGVILRPLHSEATAAAVKYSSSEPIGVEEDVHSALTQLLVTRLDQGRIPVAVVPKLPDLGDTLTDPYRWLYGRVRSENHGITGVVGEEGSTEVVRVDGLTFEELR